MRILFDAVDAEQRVVFEMSGGGGTGGRNNVEAAIEIADPEAAAGVLMNGGDMPAREAIFRSCEERTAPGRATICRD